MSEHLKKKKLSKEESDALYRWLTERWKLTPKVASDMIGNIKDRMKSSNLETAFMEEWICMTRQGMLERVDEHWNPKFDVRQGKLF